MAWLQWGQISCSRNECLWCFQLSNFDHMYGYGILTWYGYLRLGHSPFFSPLVTFLSCPTGAYLFSFHLVSGVLVFSLVIYWHFLDITLRHTKAYPFVFRDWDVWFLAYSNHVVAFSCSSFSLCCCAWLVFLGFSILVGTLSRYLPGPLFGTRTDPYPVLIRILPFLVLARTLLRYSPGFYLSRYSSGPFFGSPRFNPFSVLSRTLSRYSPVPFLDTLPDPFLVLDGPFSGTRRNPSPVLARTFLRYSPRFYLSRYSPDHFPVLARTLFWYSPEPFSGTLPEPFPVLTQILPLSQDSLRYFSNTRLDPSPVLTRILPLSGTRLDMISSMALCPDFLGFSGTHSDLIHFPLVYSSIVSGSPSLFG